MQKDMRSLKSGIRYVWAYMILGTFLTLPILWLQNQMLINTDHHILFLETITKLFLAFQTIILVFGSLGLFLKYFERKNTLILYLSDSSYWFYLIHFPIIVSMQIVLLYSEIPGYFRFWIVLGVTTIISLLTYQFWVRYSFLGTLLHGNRKKEDKYPHKFFNLKVLINRAANKSS
jgi:glucan biosynthesis protein C